MSKSRGFSHVLDVYDTHLHLCTTKGQLRRHLRDMGGVLERGLPEDADGATMSTIEYPPTGGSVHHLTFYIPDAADRPPSARANVCAHEAAHAAGEILGRKNAETDPRDEHVAYLIGWLTEWLWTHLPNPRTEESS